MNPNDPAYDWSVYDRTVFYAQQHGIKVVFSIVGTPPWANGAKGVNVVPKSALDLERFATAAARRYSGTFRTKEGRILPPVRQWLAWNEPNNPAFLRPQYTKVNGKPVIQSAIDYAKICNAVVKGVRKTTLGASKVACGVTGPRGNNNPNSARPAVSPLPFLRAMKKAGAKGFDAYAHHPYYGAPRETPSTPPPPGIHGNAADRDHARQHQPAHSRGDAPVREQADLDHRVRLPDEPARPDLRRLVPEPVALPDAGLRDRQAESADRHVPLVPAARRARSASTRAGSRACSPPRGRRSLPSRRSRSSAASRPRRMRPRRGRVLPRARPASRSPALASPRRCPPRSRARRRSGAAGTPSRPASRARRRSRPPAR